MAKGNILIVDGDRDHVRMLATVIERYGYTVLLADSVNEALAKISEVRPALIVMSITLNDGSAYDVMRSLGPQVRLIPVVLLLKADTEQALQVQRNWALAQGAVEVFSKPVDREHLLEFIDKALEANTAVIPSRAISEPANSIKQSQSASILDERILRVAEQILASHLGPVAKIIIHKAAVQSIDLTGFYQQLAQHLPEKEQRQALFDELNRLD